MCLASHPDRRIPTLIAIGMFCLVLSLGSQGLNLTFGLRPVPLHFLRGLFLGFCVAAQLRALWIVRRQRREG